MKGVDVVAVIDAQVADCRSTGHTGNVEALIEAHNALVELQNSAQAYLQGEYHDPETEYAINFRARRRTERERLMRAIAASKGTAP